MDEHNEPQIIENFKEICAVDDDTARQFLARCDWNMEAAVQDYLNFQEGRPLAFEEAEVENIQNIEQESIEPLRRRHLRDETPPVSDTARSFRSSAQVRRLGPALVGSRAGLRRRPPQTWIEWLRGLILLPFHFTYQSLFDLFQFILSFLYRPALTVADPEGDVRAFIENFEIDYGTVHPNFFRGSYSQALQEAKKEFRFLLVYLHNERHQDTRQFVSETLLSREIIQYFNANLIFWACSVTSPEGQKTSMTLRENTYPFMALICYRDNRMAMVVRLEGNYGAQDVLGVLDVAIADNRVYLDEARRQREQLDVNSQIRMEQEQAYQASLAHDRNRMNERKRAESERLIEEKRLEDERLAGEAKLQLFEAKKREIQTSQIGDEPTDEQFDVVKVSLKFPNGSRLQRRFLLDDSLENLFNVALVHSDCPRNFSLVTSYPRRTLNCAPEWYRQYYGSPYDPGNIGTFRDERLEKAVMVLVQNNEA